MTNVNIYSQKPVVVGTKIVGGKYDGLETYRVPTEYLLENELEASAEAEPEVEVEEAEAEAESPRSTKRGKK